MSSPTESLPFSCPIEMLFTPQEMERPPKCNSCRQRTHQVFARTYSNGALRPENYCSRACWEKSSTWNTSKEKS